MQRQDLKINQGSDWTHSYTVCTFDGSPVDLTGYSARMSVKSAISAHDSAYLTDGLDAIGGTITLGDELGTVALTMTALDTTGLYGVYSEGRYETFLYDLELITGAGAVERILEGRIFLSREVTS